MSLMPATAGLWRKRQWRSPHLQHSAHIVPKDDSPLVFARVHYGSSDVRRLWLLERIKEWCQIVQALHPTDDQLNIASRILDVEGGLAQYIGQFRPL